MEQTQRLWRGLAIGRSMAILLLAALAAACDRMPATPADPYANVELKSPPARVTAQRGKGAYAEGAALSMGAELKPLDPSPVKTVRLDTTHKVIDIMPGVKFTAWTFGDQVPGPTIRARVGDRIKFVMTNRSDEPVGRPEFVTAPMMHSMDFHAAMVSPQDKYRSIAPGQTIEFEFVANYPGIFMYHCGTPMVLEHIASGMYGAIIVEPKNGYPGKVDREFVVVQSEFYTRLDAQKRRVDGAALHVLDTEKLRASQPNHTVFNGHHDHLIKKPLQAKPGERVRLFVLNVGPSKTTSFHVVGTIFDKVWIEGNPDNQMRGMQTVLLGSSNSAIVEFLIPEAGAYVMVDHHFANASQGAIGLIAAGGKAEEAEQEHHNLPASAAPTDPEALQAKTAFESKCVACHAISGGEGKKIGPDLLGVTQRRSEDWITRFLRSPEQMLASDPTAKALLDKYKVPMPNQNLSEAEIKGYLKYFRFNDGAQPAKPVAKK
ncbi:MAG: multicopper oxidase domain-containing protein [Woeseiaceae bacterium]